MLPLSSEIKPEQPQLAGRKVHWLQVSRIRRQVSCSFVAWPEFTQNRPNEPTLSHTFHHLGKPKSFPWSQVNVWGAELCERIIKGSRVLHLPEQSCAREELRVMLDEVEHSASFHCSALSLFLSTPFSPFHHLASAAQRRADDPAAVCVCAQVKGKGYRTNLLSDTWPTGSMLAALPRKVNLGCESCRAVTADFTHFNARLRLLLSPTWPNAASLTELDSTRLTTKHIY